MNIVKILFVGCHLALLERSTFCENSYKVTIFRGITEVQNYEKIPYLEKHPDANTDEFSEERRQALCREGYRHVQRDEKGRDYIFLENTETKGMKVYVLVNPPNPDTSDIFSADIVEVRPAYMCPTSPPTYIHVDRDHPDMTILWVIFKEQGPVFNFSQIKTYQLHFPERVEEASVEQLTVARADLFSNSGFDTDILTESQRLYMCDRGMNIAPEIGLAVDKSCTTWGRSKYYELSYLDEDEEDGLIRTYWQGFQCPTTPVMYIVTQGYEKDDGIFWSIVKNSDITRYPVPNILGYKLVVAHSLVSEGEPIPSEDEKVESNSQSRKDTSNPIPESFHSHPTGGSEFTSPFQRTFLSNATMSIDQLQYKRSENRYKPIFAGKGRAAINTDRLKNEELRRICLKGISTVFGKTARFTSDAIGRRQLYCYKNFIEPGDTSPINSRTEAFPCQTKPEIYIHIEKPPELSSYVAHVIIKEEDLALQFTQ